MKHNMAKGRTLVENLRIDEVRQDFALEMGACAICGKREQPLDVHEIARGPARSHAYLERGSWLAVCRSCHQQLGNYAYWPLRNQYALKAIVDSNWYDRFLLNRLRGRQPESIAEVEVIKAAYYLGTEGSIMHGR